VEKKMSKSGILFILDVYVTDGERNIILSSILSFSYIEGGNSKLTTSPFSR